MRKDSQAISITTLQYSNFTQFPPVYSQNDFKRKKLYFAKDYHSTMIHIFNKAIRRFVIHMAQTT